MPPWLSWRLLPATVSGPGSGRTRQNNGLDNLRDARYSADGILLIRSSTLRLASRI